MLWGTDWPHSGYFDAARMPDDAALVDLAFAFAPDAALRHRLLVSNPARLFGAQ
jgi:predicted TIM-barrel fold metal-dependent hydrolase